MELKNKLNEAQKQISDYALAFDFLSRISQFETEGEVIQGILDLLKISFAPKVLRYISSRDNMVYDVNSVSPEIAGGNQDARKYEEFENKNYSWGLSGKGFRVKVQRHDIQLGVIEIDYLKFPENKGQYLSFVLGVVDVCALAIENSNRLNQLVKSEESLKLEKQNLERALSDVKTLSGLLPICSYCKNVKNDSGYWDKIENYFHEHSDVEFSHSICKHCADKLFPELDLYSEE